MLDPGGVHEPVADGMSLMEAVAWVAGEPPSYSPKCASPVIAGFLDTLEFCSNAHERQQLKQFIPMLVGTAASDAVELGRSWMALDWTVRVLAPAWLRLAEFDAEADALEALPEIDGILTFKAARGHDPRSLRPRRGRVACHLGPSDRLGRMEPGRVGGLPRTAADDVWLKDADYALDTVLGAAATVWSRADEAALRPPVTTCNGRRWASPSA